MSNRFPFDHRPRRIAIFRALYLGDLLLSVPALRAIRVGFPGAEITLTGLPWAASFVRTYQRYVDRFVEFVGYPGIDEVQVVPERAQRFLAEQQAYGYDLVIQMHGSGRTSNTFALALGGKFTVGFSPSMTSNGLTLSALYPEHEPEIYRNLGLAALLGCPNLDPTLEYPINDDDREAAAALLQALPPDQHPLVGFHVGASRPARRWAAANFAAVADELARDMGASIIFTGGPGEEPLVQAVIAKMASRSLNLAGQTSIGSLAALISRLDLFISNDTGPAHLADAVHTPGVTIFGPSDPRRWGALNRWDHPVVQHHVGCSPCTFFDCPIDHRCLRWITPQIVSATAKELLSRKDYNATSKHSHLAHSR